MTLIEHPSGYTTELSFSAFDYQDGTAKGSVTYNDTQGGYSYTTPVTLVRVPWIPTFSNEPG